MEESEEWISLQVSRAVSVFFCLIVELSEELLFWNVPMVKMTPDLICMLSVFPILLILSLCLTHKKKENRASQGSISIKD